VQGVRCDYGATLLPYRGVKVSGSEWSTQSHLHFRVLDHELMHGRAYKRAENIVKDKDGLIPGGAYIGESLYTEFYGMCHWL
jgi:hypothetical protein